MKRDPTEDEPLLASWYARGTIEFDRINTLTDGVFAIALTLLVFDVEVPDPVPVSLGDLAGLWQNLLAFGLSFAVILRFWLLHHRFTAIVRALEPGLILLTFLMLGLVALVPFTTALLSAAGPVSHAAVVPYLGLLIGIGLVQTLMLARARGANAFRWPVGRDVHRFAVGSFLAWVGVVSVATAVAFVLPPAGIALLILGWPVEMILSRYAPVGYESMP
ncbi:TMEM175 family protein [Fodinicurvata sp. EGI_FJ10296]|uniref:TMEM175 family protein n=1 Tax=Fodinicurvata sp. EGI_FJ10296 TaxID=3231908 RepID=UPI00345216D5